MVLPTAISLSETVLSLVIRPVGDTCNLHCTYCYLGSAVDSPLIVMSRECLRQLTEEASESSSKIEFLWHGGEPLLAGTDFFKSALEFQSLNSSHFQNFIQTNGTLINREWAHFLAEKNFHVRLSLDGPQAVHDYFRTYKSSRGSQGDVIRAVRTLRAAGIEPIVSCVITEDTVPSIDSVYEFFRDLGISRLSFLPAFVQRFDQVIPPTLSPQGYALAYKRLFDLWSNDKTRIQIRELEGIVSSILGRPAGDCTFTGSCAQAVRIEPDGTVFPCELHKGELAERYGRIGNESLNEILLKRYSSRVGGLCKRLVLNDECMNCEWFKSCHGGCYASYVTRSDGVKSYYYCEARKQLFAHIRERIMKSETPLTKDEKISDYIPALNPLVTLTRNNNRCG